MVTTPQSLVSMIVKKSIHMANMMNIPVLGLVENMSYLTCPDCGRRIDLFGAQSLEREAAEAGIPRAGAAAARPGASRAGRRRPDGGVYGRLAGRGGGRAFQTVKKSPCKGFFFML